MKERKVLISGGGTGGHFYPALAVGRRLVEADGSLRLVFVGTRREVERTIMEAHKVRFHPLRMEGLMGRGLRSLRGILLLPVAFVQALALLVRYRPSLAIGVGGYSSGPIVLLAAWLRIPTVILEQNSRPGFTNRALARWVRKAAVAFESSLPFFKEKGVHLGNPVRPEFYALPRRSESEGLGLLVFGGSQGSTFLNERVTAALPLLAARRDALRIFHQTGRRDLAWVSDAYRAAGFASAVVADYFPEMASAFGRADLIICRAGATTLAEIIASRRAAILVPFAGASEDHQTGNARELEKAGAAEILSEEDATPDRLAGRILHFLDNKDGLRAIEDALDTLRTENPAGKIAALCLSLMKPRAKETAP